MERMEFNQFCEAVRDGIAEYLLAYELESVRLERVTHNNNIEHVGLVILKKGENVSPAIYLEQYYHAMKQKALSFQEVLAMLAETYCKISASLEAQPEFSLEADAIKQHVFLRLVNYEKNKDSLAHCPYIPFHDMAITFRYLVRMDEEGIASAQIDFRYLENAGITVEALYEQARKNTLQLFSPFIQRLDSFLNDRFPMEQEYPELPQIYILSNSQLIYGATMMLYPEILAEFANSTGQNFYLIPSSVNEVLICLADKKMDKEMLENTLHEANEFVVSDTEFLSDTVYFYDKELGNIVA